MKFSIIVPVYNVEKYLPRCLDSVLDQEFDDYEIIAVDDESPDNSIDILNEYQKKTEKLKIIRQENILFFWIVMITYYQKCYRL